MAGDCGDDIKPDEDLQERHSVSNREIDNSDFIVSPPPMTAHSLFMLADPTQLP